MTPERSRRLPPAAHVTPVTEAMGRPVVTVDPDMGLLDLMRLFLTAGIGGAPVVSASGTLIGVVSKTDLLRELYDHSPSATQPLTDAPALESNTDPTLEKGARPACRARDIMTASPVVVPEHASLAHAAGLMAEEHVHRVLVVDHSGTITGILSTSDIVHWLARTDAVP